MTGPLYKLHANSENLYFDLSAVLPLDDKPTKSKNNWNAVAVLKERIEQIGKDRILFGTDWPLTDIDPYIKLLDSALGTSTVQSVLKNKIYAD